MPFLVDSVRIALNRLGITAHLLLHSPITLVRADDHELCHFVSENKSQCVTCNKETVFHIEIDRQEEQIQLDSLTDELSSVLSEVACYLPAHLPQRNEALHPVCGHDPGDRVHRFAERIGNRTGSGIALQSLHGRLGAVITTC